MSSIPEYSLVESSRLTLSRKDVLTSNSRTCCSLLLTASTRRSTMFEEAQLYSPVTQSDDGKVEVHLGKDHPGINDPVYRARRNDIAAAAMDSEAGQPVPP